MGRYSCIFPATLYIFISTYHTSVVYQPNIFQPSLPPKPLVVFLKDLARPFWRTGEVLLRAVRDLALSPIHRAWAEDLVANAISGSPAALSAEEAFQIYAELMKNLQPVPWSFLSAFMDEIGGILKCWVVNGCKWRFFFGAWVWDGKFWRDGFRWFDLGSYGKVFPWSNQIDPNW